MCCCQRGRPRPDPQAHFPGAVGVNEKAQAPRTTEVLSDSDTHSSLLRMPQEHCLASKEQLEALLPVSHLDSAFPEPFSPSPSWSRWFG